MPLAHVLEPSPDFLRSCLVEGDSAQEARGRRNKHRALLISIAFQILVVAALVLFPLFTKGENIANRAIALPTIPYSPGRIHREHSQKPVDPSRGKPAPCRFCPPQSIPRTIVEHDPAPIGDVDALVGSPIPGIPEGRPVPGALPLIDAHRESPQPPLPPKERLRVSAAVIAARLVRRIEPIYPPIAVQTRREGRVELRAIISTDGSIESLEVVSGDPFFLQSALSAVRQWRYQPTLLNGQPVEVDTHVTVIYTLGH